MATVNGTPFNDNYTFNYGQFRPGLVGTNPEFIWDPEQGTLLTTGADSIYGYSGNDLLFGLGGGDYLDGGTGVDIMYGGEGNDTYVVDHQNDQVIEGSFQGIDTVISSITFPLGYTLGDNQENLILTVNAYEGYGNSLDNRITGNNLGNRLDGEAGDDYINGGFGSDDLYGGSGNDSLIGGFSNDYLFGEADNDSLVGGWGNDFLSGDSGNDELYGDSGNDELYGGTGNDSLIGGSGDDYLSGHSGNGGTSYDVVTGGTGGDTFALGFSTTVHYLGNGYATITDFNSAEGDFVEVAGSVADYSLIQSGSNTNISYNNDLIAIVQNALLTESNLVSAPIVNPPI
ncbi:calcium-binding protein [Aerosakkonemataceae cyanobacterium BLCC-F154]|uniref:Calcium-binding protein n=1 Tax=Floridaenema fluviatile BLCC-F154 TaxID=3153640 RepID=A0ABV4YDK2_9CYAN